MLLNNVYRVRVVENPVIKKINKNKFSLSPYGSSKTYDMYMLNVGENLFERFDDKITTYIYCESVKDYIKKGLFQKTDTVIDFVSSQSIAEEFGFGNTKDVDIKKIQNVIELYNERKIEKEQLKKMLWDIVKEEEVNKYNYREMD